MVKIFGRVQGVFYRQWTVNQARALGVSGWVRNCADGTVEAQVMGAEEDVATLIAAMHVGPSQAHVENVMAEPIEPKDVSGFSVRA